MKPTIIPAQQLIIILTGKRKLFHFPPPRSLIHERQSVVLGRNQREIERFLTAFKNVHYFSTNCNNINSSEVQNIKVEPDLVARSGGGVIATVTTAVDDEDDSSNSEYFLADLRKRKHSPSSIEQTLSLTTKKESTACS